MGCAKFSFDSFLFYFLTFFLVLGIGKLVIYGSENEEGTDRGKVSRLCQGVAN